MYVWPQVRCATPLFPQHGSKMFEALKVSGMLAVYGLFVMYKATHELLHEWNTTAKFVAVKLVIGVSTVQDMVIEKLVEDVFPPPPTSCLRDPLHPGHLGRAVVFWRSYLTLIETVVLAGLIIRAFPAEEVKDYHLKNLDLMELELRQIHQRSRQRGERLQQSVF